MEKFLNQNSVRDSLGVGKIHFVSCSTKVSLAMFVDWMRNLEIGIPPLLEDGTNLLVYAGEYDLMGNWLVGNSRLVRAMEWSGQKEFATSLKVPFVVDGSEAGLLKIYGPLSFLKAFLVLTFGHFRSSKKTGKGKSPRKGVNRFWKSIVVGLKTPRAFFFFLLLPEFVFVANWAALP
ncbi:hypothetical protein JHK82_027617 [Glycine max]|nr:hypothetical protein JHK82_027617 [Glycine max]